MLYLVLSSVYNILFVHFPINRWSGCFQYFPIINNVEHFGVQIASHECTSLSEIARWDGLCNKIEK
jgi:hypothetical protein